MRLRRLVLVAILAGTSLFACRARRVVEGGEPAPAPASSAPASAPRAVDAELRPSEVRVVGLAIPVGFVRIDEATDGNFAYRGAGVEPEALRRYVAARVEPREVHAFGPSATQYLGARVTGSTDDGHRLDLVVRPSIEGAVLQIHDVAPIPLPPGTTQADRERAIERAWTMQPE